jgi:uncharacterized membrane protein YedE/YeeE
LIATAPILIVAAALGQAFGWRHGALWLIAVALGVAFLHSAFGFSGAYRRLLAERRTAGVRAQLLLLGATASLFVPAFAVVPGVRGFVFPAGAALLVGAFLFGIGMQLGGGCGSGTLYAAGAGRTRMWITLAAFIAGSTLAAWQWDVWRDWPALPPLSLAAELGGLPALALTLGLLAALFAAARGLEAARHGRVEPLTGPFRPLRGPWPPLAGAIAIALLSLATLMVANRPWAITAAFPLWGSRLVEAAGLDDPAFWPWWEDPTRTEAYLRPLLADRITVMDLGVIAGAFLAARLARTPGRWTRPTRGEIAASLAGGLLLGIGAMLAGGCNISAFLAGVASFSVHGWAWIAPALIGNAVGLRLRPLFGLERGGREDAIFDVIRP